MKLFLEVIRFWKKGSNFSIRWLLIRIAGLGKISVEFIILPSRVGPEAKMGNFQVVIG